ncbi:hypothetical protein B0H14DRAFT_3514802 [Mycena olivaceomarginata]|nr:hypothetical protein B0H14DRAFT_3514802 [Mycena olivaceomarginata]
MQFSNIFFMAIPVATQPCCAQLNGNYNSANGDCAAGSISEHLSNFRSCCQTWQLNNVRLTSDCDFPKRALEDLEKIDTPQGEGGAQRMHRTFYSRL